MAPHNDRSPKAAHRFFWGLDERFRLCISFGFWISQKQALLSTHAFSLQGVGFSQHRIEQKSLFLKRTFSFARLNVVRSLYFLLVWRIKGHFISLRVNENSKKTTIVCMSSFRCNNFASILFNLVKNYLKIVATV